MSKTDCGTSCCCAGKRNPSSQSKRWIAMTLAALALWGVVYSQLEAFADWAVSALTLSSVVSHATLYN